MKVILHIVTTEGYQLILSNTDFNCFDLIVLEVSLQDTQENPSHYLLATFYLFLIFHLFIPEGKSIFLKNKTFASW